MDRVLASILIGAVFLLAIAGMYWGWRARSRNQAGLSALDRAPDDLGSVLVVANGLYVATTLRDQPLERVTVRGLGFRSRTTVTVARAGIVLALTGQEPIFLARGCLRRVHRATWTIDKAVETAGLVVVTWTLGDRDVDSYLRLDGDTEDFVALANELVEVQQ